MNTQPAARDEREELRQATTPAAGAREFAQKYATVSGSGLAIMSLGEFSEALTTFAAARVAEAVEREREACARVAESFPTLPNGHPFAGGNHVAAAIRARKP